MVIGQIESVNCHQAFDHFMDTKWSAKRKYIIYVLFIFRRPKTATLKRPHILDESLKDKVDMTLTKKEFLAAVKLCSDVAVQRGLPNMRLKAAGKQPKSPTKKGFQPVRPDPTESSPYMSKLLGKIMGKRKGKRKISYLERKS